MIKDFDSIQKVYQALPEKIKAIRQLVGRPLSLAEKILLSHLKKSDLQQLPQRGKDIIPLLPDRVAMQDATAQMAILQFMLAGMDTVAVPTTIHCDHLIQARIGASEDLTKAEEENGEVYAFLKSAASKYGIGFWGPGSGIIHQVVLENYAFPGALIIGTDSHTPNGGGLGMLAIGVGGADAVDVMVGNPWLAKMPKLIGIHLKGKLSGWTAPKDIILKIASILTVKGGTGYILEYFGEGTASISCTGKATITNMGAEVGATTSVFPFDAQMAAYLKATGRDRVAALAEEYAEHLKADAEVQQDPEKIYDKVIEIDLSSLEPHLVGPHTPDLARQVSELHREVVTEKKYPEEVRVALIGSCTNSSYEDITRAADVARQATTAGLKAAVPFYISPGSETIYATIERDGLLADLQAIGGVVLANACGPCIGQWQREDMPKGERNVIVTSFNRNFPGRNDGNPETLSFIGSPEIVTAFALSGKLSFNPMKDTIEQNGKSVQLKSPAGEALPANGLEKRETGFQPPLPKESRTHLKVTVAPDSKRLQELTPFEPWDGKDIERCIVLIKAKGKCTTDHISPAGRWLRYRGHLENISRNFFIMGINDFLKKRGKAKNLTTGEIKEPWEVALEYKKEGIPWVVVGDVNYGEGSSREHAAMTPRFLGCRAVIVKSFARIHESNLKKQGILPFTFVNKENYDQIKEDTRISLIGLSQLAPGKTVTAKLYSSDGNETEIALATSLTKEEIHWFQAGSALNALREKRKL